MAKKRATSVKKDQNKNVIHRGDVFKDQNKKSSGKNKVKSTKTWWPSVWDD